VCYSKTTMAFFLGIDGGGSKTECVLADESGAVLARAAGAGSNLRRATPEELRGVIGGCLEDVRRTAGMKALSLEAVGAGFAGASDSGARAKAREVLAALLQPRCLYVVGDMEVALEAAVGAGRGVVLIAGTGSIAYGRNDLGQQARAGGRGPLVGDEGSGFDIGRAAVEAAQHGPATVLSEALPPARGADTPEKLAAWLAPERAAELASLVPVVARAARCGDAVAAKILEQAGAALAELALEVLRRLDLVGAEVRVAASGGVFKESPEVLARVQAELLKTAPRAHVELLAVSPAEGAVRLAQRLWLQERTAPV